MGRIALGVELTGTRAAPTIVGALTKSGAFKQIPAEDIRDLARSATSLTFSAGKSIVRQGARGGDVFVIVSGRASVTVNNGSGAETLAHLGPGAVIGEIAHVTGARRAATVTAATKTVVARLPAKQIEALLADYPAVAVRLADDAHRLMLDKHLLEALTEVLGPLSERVRSRIRKQVEWLRLDAGAKLFSRGDVEECAYIVLFGRLTRDDGRSVTDAIVGLEALIDDAPRPDTVVAARSSWIARLPRSAYALAAAADPSVAARIARRVIRSAVTGASARRRPQRLNIAIRAGSGDVDLRLAASQLARTLAVYGSTAHVWSAQADATLGRPMISQSGDDDALGLRLSQWLNELEDGHRFVVSEPDATETPWTSRVVRHADIVLTIARAGSTEPVALESRARHVLVLLHSAGSSRPTGTAAALDAFGAAEVVHIRDGSDDDLHRLARIVAGIPIALILGGGGARGFAHLGVMQAMRDLGIPIDIVGGTSIGAILAALPASGMTPEEGLAMAQRELSRIKDYTIPTVSIIKAKRITRAIASQAGDHDALDMWLTFFCMTTNLTRAQEVAHRRGRLVQILRASSAVPGMMPPVRIGDDLHIDGGVLNNVPVDVVRTAYPGATIIGVDVSPPVGPRAKADFDLWVSGGKALRDRMRKRRGPPALTETLISATVVASLRERDRCIELGIADLWLALDTRGVNLLDFSNVAGSAAKGFEQSKPLLESWLRDGGSATEPIHAWSNNVKKG